MNVGRLCKLIPAGLPHEYLGYPKTSLKGMLLSQELMNEVIGSEKSLTPSEIRQRERINKFHRLK
jgi:hypothetical protein